MRPKRPFIVLAVLAGLASQSLPATISAAAPAQAGSPQTGAVQPLTVTGSTPIAPGVVHRWGTVGTDDSAADAVHIVEVAPGDPRIGFEALLSNGTAVGIAKTSTTAAALTVDGRRVVAMVNGDTFNGLSTPPKNAPAGLQVHGGELQVARREARPTIGFRADGSAIIGSPQVSITASVTSGSPFGVARVNQVRRSNEVALYTERFGPSTMTGANGVEVTLTGPGSPLPLSGSVDATVASVGVGTGDSAIAPGDLVLSGSGTIGSRLATLQVGETVHLDITVTDGWADVTEALSGRHLIIDEGVPLQIVPLEAEVYAPRTGIGIRPDGTIVLVTVDGRQPGYSRGMKISELTELLLEQGAVDALNMDGGGSTTMMVRSPGDADASVVNRPSDGYERPVSNGLAVVSRYPTGPLAALDVRPPGAVVLRGATLHLTANGYDEAFNAVPVAPEAVTWSSDTDAVPVGPDGTVIALEAADANVVATSGGAIGSATIRAIEDAVAPVVDAPGAAFRPTMVVPATVPLRVTWPAGTDEGTGVATYEVEHRVEGGAWEAVPQEPGGRVAFLAAPSRAVSEFRLRATDGAGNVGDWVVGQPMQIGIEPETSAIATYAGDWHRETSSRYLDGVAWSSRTPGASFRILSAGTDFAIVASQRPSGGQLRVSVDGVPVDTVQLDGVRRDRRVMFTASWPTAQDRVIDVVLEASPAGSRADIDGFLVALVPATATLVGAGDIASCSLDDDEATADLIDSIPGTVFTAGDNVYPSGKAREFADCYDPTWGRFLERTRPAPGNHDYASSNTAAPYRAYFGSAAGPSSHRWYQYDAGSWRIYVLDSDCAFIGGCGPGSRQYEWLKRKLANEPHLCTLAIWHHPRFSSGLHGNSGVMRKILRLLYVHGADVVVNGHDHDYERFAPSDPYGVVDTVTGIRQFVVGTGGASLYPFLFAPLAHSEVRNDDAHGVLKLTLGYGSYAWEFVPVAGQTFTDSGTGTCH